MWCCQHNRCVHQHPERCWFSLKIPGPYAGFTKGGYIFSLVHIRFYLSSYMHAITIKGKIWQIISIFIPMQTFSRIFPTVSHICDLYLPSSHSRNVLRVSSMFFGFLSLISQIFCCSIVRSTLEHSAAICVCASQKGP